MISACSASARSWRAWAGDGLAVILIRGAPRRSRRAGRASRGRSVRRRRRGPRGRTRWPRGSVRRCTGTRRRRRRGRSRRGQVASEGDRVLGSRRGVDADQDGAHGGSLRVGSNATVCPPATFAIGGYTPRCGFPADVEGFRGWRSRGRAGRWRHDHSPRRLRLQARLDRGDRRRRRPDPERVRAARGLRGRRRRQESRALRRRRARQRRLHEALAPRGAPVPAPPRATRWRCARSGSSAPGRSATRPNDKPAWAEPARHDRDRRGPGRP